MTTFNVTISDAAARFVEEQAARAGCAGPGEYLQRLIDEQRRRIGRQEALEAKLVEGLNSGAAVVADDAYWERKAAALAERARQQREG